MNGLAGSSFMSNLSITMIGPDSARICFSSASRGTCLVAGSDAHHTINILDGDFLRRVAGELFKLRNMKYTGDVTLKIGDHPRITIDESLWRELADALLAFTINVDAGTLLGEHGIA